MACGFDDTDAGSPSTSNAAVDAMSMHSTSVHLGVAADAVAQADYSMADLAMPESGTYDPFGDDWHDVDGTLSLNN